MSLRGIAAALADDLQSEPEPENTVVVDAEEAVKKLTTKYGVPPKAKKLFGAMNIKALYEIVNDPAMLQIDALVQRGELTHEEAYEYVLVLPEYDAIRVKLLALAKNLVGVLKKSGAIRSAVKKAMPSTIMARQYKRLTPGKELQELTVEVDQFAYSQIVKGVDSFRNGWLIRLRAMTQEFLAAEVIMEMNKPQYSDFDREFLERVYFLYVDKASERACDQSFSVIAMKEYKDHFDHLLDNNDIEFSNMLNNRESEVFKDAKYSDSELAEENALMFEEIKNQASSNRIKTRTKKFGNVTLEIPIDLGGAVHQDLLTVVTIHLKDDAEYNKIQYQIKKLSHGVLQMSFLSSPASFEFMVDRSTGNICYTTTLVPVRYSMDSKSYALLRNLVYSFLLDNLEGRLEPVEQGVDETRSELEECLDEPANDVLTDRIGFARKYPSVHPPAEDTRTEEEIWDEEWKICRYRARGKNGRIILAAIKRILRREPIRIMGSHQVFEGDNGKRCPIPIHPSDTMALGSLKNFLITLDISPLALADEL